LSALLFTGEEKLRASAGKRLHWILPETEKCEKLVVRWPIDEGGEFMVDLEQIMKARPYYNRLRASPHVLISVIIFLSPSIILASNTTPHHRMMMKLRPFHKRRV